MAGAAVFLGERVSLVMIGGGLLILAGVAVASTGRRRSNAKEGAGLPQEKGNLPVPWRPSRRDWNRTKIE